MKNKTFRLIENLEEEVQLIDLEEGSIFDKSKRIVELLESGFNEIKVDISEYGFANEAEEIRFFKETKPQLFCKLIYYSKISNIEALRPTGSDFSQKDYINNELDQLTVFFNKNIEFYKYYRSGNTILDKYYFLRGRHDILINAESFYFERDPNFSTTRDFTVATILSNELLRIYLNEELHKLESHSKEETPIPFPKAKHTWTDNKTALVELIYALHSKGCFDHGNIDIKTLAAYLSNVFNTDAGDFYRIYLNIKNRKDSRTSFLDSLSDNLNKKMDDDDIR